MYDIRSSQARIKASRRETKMHLGLTIFAADGRQRIEFLMTTFYKANNPRDVEKLTTQEMWNSKNPQI